MAEIVHPPKKFWRCTICGDIHYGFKPPEICPTCKQVDKYVEITRDDAVKSLGLAV